MEGVLYVILNATNSGWRFEEVVLNELDCGHASREVIIVYLIKTQLYRCEMLIV